MTSTYISLSHLNLKRRLGYLVIILWFFTFVTLFYFRLDYIQINSEKSNDFNKNIDLQTPKISIVNPLNNTYYNNSPLVQINTTDTFEINQTWYLIIGSGENKTFVGNSVEINIGLWQMQPDGLVMIRFYANNSIGQENFTDLQIIKDTNPPTIVIHSPQNGTIVGEDPPDFNVTIFDVNFHKFWFIFNTSDEIYFWRINSGNNLVWLPFTEWQTIPPGHLLVRFYANDTVGNTNSFDIMIIKQLTERKIIIPGINSSVLYLVFILTSTLIIISSIRKIKKLFC